MSRCRSGFGRKVLATGGDEMAARYSIDTRSIKFKVLVLSSCAAALAGMLYAGVCNRAASSSEGDELSVIAAAVLERKDRPDGGRGRSSGTIVGALMIRMINSGLIPMGLEFSQAADAKGAIIVPAVAALSQKRADVYDHRNPHRPPETREELASLLMALSESADAGRGGLRQLRLPCRCCPIPVRLCLLRELDRPRGAGRASGDTASATAGFAA